MPLSEDAVPAASPSPGDDRGRERFHPLRVAEVRRETSDAVSVAFEVPPELSERFRYRPGQYLTLRVPLDGAEVRRCYSICSTPADPALRVAIKLVANGRFSAFVNRRLRPGDVLDVMPPMGHFTLTPEPGDGRYVAFAAGSGITPIVSIVGHVLADEPRARVSLIYGNRTVGSILFLEELARLKDRHVGRLQILHVLSAEEDEIALFNGRIDREKCALILDRVLPADAQATYLCCGPSGMMQAVEQSLLARGVDPTRIQLERFGAPALPVDAPSGPRSQEAAGRTLSVVFEGRRVRIPFDATAGNILDSARLHGVPAPYACKGGVCATCRARVVSGTVEMRVNYGLSAAEVEQGYVLTCQAVPLGDDVVVTYDA